MFRLFLLCLSIGPILVFGELQKEERFFFIKPWIPINIPTPRPRPATNFCPVLTTGCATGGDGVCDANTMMCTTPDSAAMPCYWPATTAGTCTANPALAPAPVECLCGN